MLMKHIHPPQGSMKLYFIICVFVFSEKLQMSRSSTVESYFFYVQSGVTQSNACILKEFPVKNSTVSALLKCGMHCNALSQCVGVDIIGKEAKRCRLLYELPALIPTLTTSDETVRYQKVLHFYNYMFECDHFLLVMFIVCFVIL